MPIQRLFPDLGAGVGLRPTHFPTFAHQKPSSVSWVEVISENYMPWDGKTFGRHAHQLRKIRQDLPVALHGVSLSVGSVDSIDFEYLKTLKCLIDFLSPCWVSDHLCWTRLNGEHFHDLLPIPFTEEALQIISSNIMQVQDFLGRRILIENVSSYLEFSHSEMSEWEFINQLLEKADCGLLLDLNNVYVNSVNHQFEPIEFLGSLPTERIGEIHLAGHSVKDLFLIDTHDTSVSDEVWKLYQWTIQKIGPVSSMVERDGNIPPWNVLETEIKKIRELRDEEEVKSVPR
jgi:uncharacterized protein